MGNTIYTMLETMSVRFHADWNWIMNVVDSIEEAEVVPDKKEEPVTCKKCDKIVEDEQVAIGKNVCKECDKK